MGDKQLSELELLRLQKLYLTVEVQQERSNHARSLALSIEKDCQTMIHTLLRDYVPSDEIDQWQINVQTGAISPRTSNGSAAC
jgi:hypothetical protein